MPNQLWFYVSDHGAVRDILERVYTTFGLKEWSAEPAFVNDRANDADIVVKGNDENIKHFTKWLKNSYADRFREVLMIEGETVTSDRL